MPRYCLTARFPLGIYLGHTGDANRDPSPDPARLHAALLNAAAQGCSAVADQDERWLAPSEKALRALEWIDENPPTGLAMPEQQWLSTDRSRMMFREVSSVIISKNGVERKTENRAVSDGVAVNGRYGYVWDDMPSEIADTITELLPDVSCLGESTSLVILEKAELEPNFVIDPEATAFSIGRKAVRVATTGRTQHLVDTFRSNYGKKRPTKASDKFTSSDTLHPPGVAGECLATARYSPVSAELREASTPWAEAIIVEATGKQLAQHEYVSAAVALHRALIARIRVDVSPVITGRYPEGTVRPANNLAIQYLPHKYVECLGINSSVFVLLVPKGTDAATYEQLQKALTGVFPLRSRGKILCQLQFNGRVVRADEFWPAPQPGMARLWQPLNVFIPESRPNNRPSQYQWTLADAGLLSVAHVWRESFATDAKGPGKYIELRNKVKASGVRVFRSQPVTRQVRNFVHRTNKSLTVQPWKGLIYLANLLPSTAIAALGQSRHLGGGLLVPFDVSTQDFQAMLKEEADA